MDIRTNIPLKNFTTMKLGGPARFFVEVRSPKEVVEVYKNAKAHNLPVFILGGGSNVVATDEGFAGIIIRIRIPGFTVIADDINATMIQVGAGEPWDSVVERAVSMNLSGIEALSGIPGTTGGTPIQNVGAFGQEVSETIESLVAYDTQTDTFVTIQNADCEFTYRNSIFRAADMGRYIVTSIIFKLSKNPPQPPFYEALQTYFAEHSITIFTVKSVRAAVLDIRTNKLPDPALMPNTGSFFKNAIVEDWQLSGLRAISPDIPTYDMGDDHYKVPTGWLIEQTGLKGKVLHGMKIHDKNALVLINESATSYADLAAARDEIIGAVRDKFQIQIEQEPLEI